jgi:hypothetical protein
MPDLHPVEVAMTARPRKGWSNAFSSMLASAPDESIGKFVVNTVDRTVTFNLHQGLADSRVAIHGFAPEGWLTDPLFRIEPGQTVWNYKRGQVENILAGLAYMSVHTPNSDRPLTAQIVPEVQDEPKFEDYVTLTAMAGECQGRMTLNGHFEDVLMELEPAQVIIARSGATTNANGLREQILGCSVRVGGAHVEGLGRIEIGMFGKQNPGRIVSETPSSDFPAKMTLDVSKSYITPFGDFYRDNELFEAGGIMRFPPFGTKFHATDPIAPMRNVRTDEVIGHIKLGWLVPLCYLDPEEEFPSKAVATAEFEEEVTA